MKQQKQKLSKLEGELIDSGFKPIGVCPKRMYKIEGNKAMIFELIPQHYELVYYGIKEPIEKWVNEK